MSGVGRAAERKLVFCGCEDACALLKTDADRGLDDGDVASRRLAYGPNELAEEEEGACRKFLEQLKEPLILLLFGSAVVSSLLGQYDDAISIAVAVLIVTLFASCTYATSGEPPLSSGGRRGAAHNCFCRGSVRSSISAASAPRSPRR